MKGTMNMTKRFILIGLGALFMGTVAHGQGTLVVPPTEPVVASVKKAKPFELVAGKFIPLVLLSVETDANIPIVAQVTSAIYDEYQNVAIPAGSKLVGQYKQKVGSRYQVFWTGLQVPTGNGTQELVPPINATDAIGASGIADFRPGQRAGGIVSSDFIVLH
jgi:type IV secretory pathway VirB10-like protein